MRSCAEHSPGARGSDELEMFGIGAAPPSYFGGAATLFDS